ncbi:unnamed protein product [Amoebophrya sp. A120]|nr:unnamed protein product [Amoebophrya sp. A120]|eukprot:GSA120T00017110001.1
MDSVYLDTPTIQDFVRFAGLSGDIEAETVPKFGTQGSRVATTFGLPKGAAHMSEILRSFVTASDVASFVTIVLYIVLAGIATYLIYVGSKAPRMSRFLIGSLFGGLVLMEFPTYFVAPLAEIRAGNSVVPLYVFILVVCCVAHGYYLTKNAESKSLILASVVLAWFAISLVWRIVFQSSQYALLVSPGDKKEMYDTTTSMEMLAPAYFSIASWSHLVLDAFRLTVLTVGAFFFASWTTTHPKKNVFYIRILAAIYSYVLTYGLAEVCVAVGYALVQKANSSDPEEGRIFQSLRAYQNHTISNVGFSFTSLFHARLTTPFRAIRAIPAMVAFYGLDGSSGLTHEHGKYAAKIVNQWYESPGFLSSLPAHCLLVFLFFSMYLFTANRLERLAAGLPGGFFGGRGSVGLLELSPDEYSQMEAAMSSGAFPSALPPDAPPSHTVIATKSGQVPLQRASKAAGRATRGMPSTYAPSEPGMGDEDLPGMMSMEPPPSSMQEEPEDDYEEEPTSTADAAAPKAATTTTTSSSNRASRGSRKSRNK